MTIGKLIAGRPTGKAMCCFQMTVHKEHSTDEQTYISNAYVLLLSNKRHNAVGGNVQRERGQLLTIQDFTKM